MDRLKKTNLLFLEDNEEFAKNTTELLSMHFKKVYHVSSIKYAYAAINDYKIDFIIADIKLQAIPLHIEAYESKPLSYEKFNNIIKTISIVSHDMIQVNVGGIGYKLAS